MLPKKFASKHLKKVLLVHRLLNLRTWMILKSSLAIFQAQKISAAPFTSVVFAASVASTASTVIFSQRISWSWWFHHPWHQNDQYWSLFMEYNIKFFIFHWYMVPFLSEAVEVSLCYFFENWLMKCKCPNLRNTQLPSFYRVSHLKLW